MTHRREDPNVLEWLRRLQAEVKALQKDGGVKHNNTRLGDWVVEVDDNGCLIANNVVTGEQTSTCTVGEQLREIVWMFPGEINVDGFDTDAGGPLWYPPSNIEVIEIAMYLQQNFMPDIMFVQVEFTKNLGGSVLGSTYIHGSSDNRHKTSLIQPFEDGDQTRFDAGGTYLGTWYTTRANTIFTPDTPLSVRVNTYHPDPGYPLGDDLTAVIRYRFTDDTPE